MCPLSDKNTGKSFLNKIIDIMADMNVIERRRSTDRRKNSIGYVGPERRSGIDRRQFDLVD